MNKEEIRQRLDEIEDEKVKLNKAQRRTCRAKTGIVKK